MKDLQVMMGRDSGIVQGSAVNFGKWDISKGLKTTIYLHNPNSYVKANLKNLKNKDARVMLSLPDEVMPGATEPVDISISPMKFDSDKDEEAFFNDVLDSISGKIIWEKP